MFIDDGDLFVTGELSQGTQTCYDMPYLGSILFSDINEIFDEELENKDEELNSIDQTDYEQFIRDWLEWYNDQSYPDEENKEFHRPLLDYYCDLGY